jgi:hypothetical protein
MKRSPSSTGRSGRLFTLSAPGVSESTTRPLARSCRSRQCLLLLNEVQRICHENSVGGWETEAGALHILKDLTNLHSIVLVWNSLQNSPVQIDGINRAIGSQ